VLLIALFFAKRTNENSGSFAGKMMQRNEILSQTAKKHQVSRLIFLRGRNFQGIVEFFESVCI
jgi:hypothetical protein